MKVECVLTAGCTLGESPTWHARTKTLYWADISGRTLHQLEPATGDHHIIARGCLIAGILVEPQESLLLLGSRGRVWRYCGGVLERVLRASVPLLRYRFNDCIAEPDGQVLAGVMPYEADLAQQRVLAGLRRRLQRSGVWSRPGERTGRVCRLDRHGVVRTVLPDIGRPNGMAFSPDARKLYVTDSARQRILALEYDRGTLGPPEVLVETSGIPGTPDGLVTDESGCLWSARNRAGEIVRYDPQGQVMARVKLPVAGVTSLCFGGEDGTDLYLTSAAGGHTPEAAAGGIFRLPVGIRGTPVFAAEISGQGSVGD